MSQEQDRLPREVQRPVAVSRAAARQNGWRNLRLVLGREYRTRVRRRSFRTTTVILAVAVGLFAFVPTISQFISQRTHRQAQLVVVDNAGSVAGMSDSALAALVGTELNGSATGTSAPYSVTVETRADIASVRSQVSSGRPDVALVLTRSAQGDLRFDYISSATRDSDGHLPPVTGVARQVGFLDAATRLGLTPAQVGTLTAPPALTLDYTGTQPVRSGNQQSAGLALAFAGAFLVYVGISLYMNIVAAGIAEEKSGRITEILVTAATPGELLVGKIAGVGAVCLTQFGTVVAVGIVALEGQVALLGASNAFGQYLAGVTVPFLLLFLVYFLLAFFFYASIAAGLVAVVKRQEEVQSAVMPLTLLVVLGWILVYAVVAIPTSTFAKVLSYIPFFTPEIMLVRIAQGGVAWWEIAVTIGEMVVAVGAALVIGVRLFRLGVLMYGQRPGFRHLIRMALRD